MEGNLTFEYKVSSEDGYDGLILLIDEFVVLSEGQIEWNFVTFNLSQGYHTIQWYYIYLFLFLIFNLFLLLLFLFYYHYFYFIYL